MKKKILIVIACAASLVGCEDQVEMVEIENSNELLTSNLKAGIYHTIPNGYNYVWGDEFNGAELDDSKWGIGCYDDINNTLLPGAEGKYFHGGEYMAYNTIDNCVVSDGTLKLITKKETIQGVSPNKQFEYTTGRIHSYGRASWDKCYVEIRCKWPTGNKVWPALWMVAENLRWPPEWDMWEYFGDLNFLMNDQMGNTVWYNEYPNQESSEKFIGNFIARYDAANTYHRYGFEWTGEYAIWSIDGYPKRIINSYDLGSLWPNENMLLILNNGLRSTSSWDNTTFPNALTIDYVRVYQRPDSYNLMPQNSGFELGSATGWHQYGIVGPIKTNARTGNWCGTVQSMYGGFEYYIDGLEPDTEYTFAGQVKTHGGARAYVAVKNHGNDETTQEIASDPYKAFHITFTTGSEATSAKLCFFKYGDVGHAFGDDFRLYK